MKLFIITKALIYILLELLFAYKLEISNPLKIKNYYILAFILILLEIIKIKIFASDFWDKQAMGFLMGYILYFYIKSQTKKD